MTILEGSGLFSETMDMFIAGEATTIVLTVRGGAEERDLIGEAKVSARECSLLVWI